jgi:Fe-S cluster assembly scaffold protein SufB
VRSTSDLNDDVSDDGAGTDLFPGEVPDVFAELNHAFMSPVVLRIPAGHVAEAPVVVTHRVGGAATALFPRLVIDAGADSEVTVIERFVSDDDTSGTTTATRMRWWSPSSRSAPPRRPG